MVWPCKMKEYKKDFERSIKIKIKGKSPMG
jgi:hypothetical protein